MFYLVEERGAVHVEAFEDFSHEGLTDKSGAVGDGITLAVAFQNA